MQHLTHALNAQALPLEFGSEGGLSGWSLGGSSLCLGAPYVCGFQGYAVFYILLSLYAYEIANTFVLLHSNFRYLISVSYFPSWERRQLPRRTCGACDKPSSGPFVWSHEPFSLVQITVFSHFMPVTASSLISSPYRIPPSLFCVLQLG